MWYHFRSLSIVVAFAAILVSSGCSVASHQGADSGRPSHDIRSYPRSDESPSVNLEKLESDPSFLRDVAPEARTLKLSDLWYERALTLQSLPGPGYLASLLRSAHLALEVLISDTCRNPFNQTCPGLDRAYTRAVDGVIRTIAVRGWKPPSLAPTRYSFDPSTVSGLADLEGWKITLPESNERGPLLRPGLGVPAIGCRDLNLVGSSSTTTNPLICSPITFIATFEKPVTADAIPVRLVPVDAYQQEVVQIANHETLLSGNIDGTIEALARNVQVSTPRPRLSCLSIPTRTTTTLLLLGRSSSFTQPLLDQIRRIPSDPILREHYTPCFYSLPDSTPPALAAKELLQTLREIVTPRSSARLERAPTPIFIAVTDEPSLCAADEALQRITRQKRLIARGRAHGAPFFARGVFALSANNNSDAPPACADALARDADELGAAFGPLRDSPAPASLDDRLLLLREMLFAARPPAPEQTQLDASAPSTPETPTDTLSVSPVL